MALCGAHWPVFLLPLQQYFFFKAIHQGPIGLVSALSSTYPAVPLVLAISIFSATLSSRQGVGFAMVIVGVVAAAGFHASDPNKIKSSRCAKAINENKIEVV